MAKDVICTATYSRPQLPSKRASKEKRKIQIKEMMTWLEMFKNYQNSQNIKSSNRSVLPQIQQQCFHDFLCHLTKTELQLIPLSDHPQQERQSFWQQEKKMSQRSPTFEAFVRDKSGHFKIVRVGQDSLDTSSHYMLYLNSIYKESSGCIKS